MGAPQIAAAEAALRAEAEAQAEEEVGRRTRHEGGPASDETAAAAATLSPPLFDGRCHRLSSDTHGGGGVPGSSARPWGGGQAAVAAAAVGLANWREDLGEGDWAEEQQTGRSVTAPPRCCTKGRRAEGGEDTHTRTNCGVGGQGAGSDPHHTQGTPAGIAVPPAH